MTELDKYKIFEENIKLITFGGPKTSGLTKTRIRRLVLADKYSYQEERIIDNKAKHINIDFDKIEERFIENITNEYKNSVIYTDKADFYIRRSKKGKLSVVKKEATKADLSPMAHNIEKNYIIPEGIPVPFLVELGIMNAEGQVRKKHYSKFRQINRFLELVDDESSFWRNRSEIKIYDLCCGKGYLTLALHYYFAEINNMKINVEGMDLKNDVITFLNSIVEKLDLKGIKFIYGDIQKAQLRSPDIVVALHACDVATDIALAAAANANAKIIMSVPCCQHELFKQIKNEDLSPILKYGIMKDKFTELSTNALRGLALESRGYSVKMIEFTTIEHTMKNIMIKAVKDGSNNPAAFKEFLDFSKTINGESSSELILGNEFKNFSKD